MDFGSNGWIRCGLVRDGTEYSLIGDMNMQENRRQQLMQGIDNLIESIYGKPSSDKAELLALTEVQCVAQIKQSEILLKNSNKEES